MNMPHHPAMLRLTFIGTDDGVEAHNSSACCCRSPPTPSASDSRWRCAAASPRPTSSTRHKPVFVSTPGALPAGAMKKWSN